MKKFATIFICVIALLIPLGQAQAAEYTGIRKSTNGVWNYYTNGEVDTSYNGLAKYNGDWWYVKNGEIRFDYTGLCKHNGTWWYVSGGKVNFKAKGLCKYNGTWWYVENGQVNFKAKTLCKYNGSWWYVQNGQVNFKANTLCKYNGQWWYVENGKVNFDYIGLFKYNGTWWYFEDGILQWDFTGIAVNHAGAWYVKNGQIDFSYTGEFSFCGAATKNVKGYDLDYKVVNGKATYKKAEKGNCPYTLYKLEDHGEYVCWYQLLYDERGLVDKAVDIVSTRGKQQAKELGYTSYSIQTTGGPNHSVGNYNVGPVIYCKAYVYSIEKK